MTTDLKYRILNVFTDGDNPFSGNPLCVFENATGLSDNEMQDLARQLNLSETTFVTPGEGGATASVRIFTPTFEMPFAGHPTLGTAHVVRDLFGAGDSIILRMAAGDIAVRAVGSAWTLQALPPTTRDVAASAEDLARAVVLPLNAVVAQPLWVNTGVEQLIVPLGAPEEVRAAQADAQLVTDVGTGVDGEAMIFIWAPTGPETIESRYFFIQNNAAVEDPATGSAVANLGGWFLANGQKGIRRRIRQGSAIQRPSVLDLEVDHDGTIYVGGTVREIGQGTFTI